MGELRPSPPTEQAVDREISLDVVGEEQIGVLARKPGLLHNRGNHLLSAALDDALCRAGVRVVIRVEQIIVIVCRRALAEGLRLRSFERGRRRQGLVDKRVEQRELVLVVQIERAAVDIGAAADIVGRITSAFIQEPFWALTAQLPQAGYNPSLEQQWAYYARYIDFMLREPASRPYLDLRSLIDHKDYFILSTNVDTQVEKTFSAERICNYQGSFAHLQCKQPCCDELFDASPYVERMLAGMAGFEVRSEDVPRCPHCGWQLAPWVRDDTFLQGAAWRESLGRYERFVRERGYGRVLLLELGVGEMTPGIITLPFWSMTAKLPDAHLLSVNISGGSAPLQLGSKAEAIQADLGVLFSAARAGDE